MLRRVLGYKDTIASSNVCLKLIRIVVFPARFSHCGKYADPRDKLGRV